MHKYISAELDHVIFNYKKKTTHTRMVMLGPSSVLSPYLREIGLAIRHFLVPVTTIAPVVPVAPLVPTVPVFTVAPLVAVREAFY